MTNSAVRYLLVGILLVSVVACSSAPRTGKVNAVRSDLEALPLPEENISLVADVSGGDPNFRVHSVTLTSQHLIIEDRKGRLYALDRGSLVPAWHYYGLPRTMDFPLYEAAASYLVVSGNRIVQISKATSAVWGAGEEMASHHLSFTPSSGPAGNDATAYVASWGSPAGNKTIYSINLADGRVGWGFRSQGHITGQPIVHGAPRQLVYFSTHEGKVYALEALGAFERAPFPSWMNETFGANSADPTLAGDHLLVPSEEGSLYAYDRATGTKAWEYISGRPLKTGVAATERAVYFHNEYGFHRLDAASGTLGWKLEEGPTTFILERGSEAWLRDAAGSIVLVDDGTGEVAGEHPLTGWFVPTNAADGTFFAVSPDGMAYAFTERLRR
jgi:outer membrane protein assembly factor BamB